MNVFDEGKKTLYNAEYKLDFIKESVESSQKNLYHIFAKIAPYEKEKGKDVCNFSEEEIIVLYKAINFKTRSSIINYHGALKRYIRWSYSKGRTQGNPWIEMTKPNDLQKYCSQVSLRDYELDRETLLNKLDLLKRLDPYNPRESFVILAAYEGICGDQLSDILNLKMSDIYKEENQYYAKLQNRTVKITDELYALADETNKEKRSYRYIKGTLTSYDLTNTEYIVRTISYSNSTPGPAGAVRITRAVVHVLREFGIMNGGIYAISRRGEIWAIRERAKELDISPKDYLITQDFVDNVCSQFGIAEDQVENHIKVFRRYF